MSRFSVGGIASWLFLAFAVFLGIGCGDGDEHQSKPAAQQLVKVVTNPRGHERDEFTGERHAPFISLSDYRRLRREGSHRSVLVDVREPDARYHVHIPGDRWMPLEQADAGGWKTLWRFRDRTIVLYCDCPWAEAAAASVILERHGFEDTSLRVLHPGIPGWIKAGLPVVRGEDPCRPPGRWVDACQAG